MSWHFLQGQEEVYSEGISWDGEQFAPSKSKSTLGEYCLQDSEMESSQDSPSGMTLQRLTGLSGEEELMWCQGDSPVRTYLVPEREQDWEVVALDCGPRWQGSLARYNPHSYSWKTAQCLLLGGLEEYSETWPRWGMMQDGECLELAIPVDIANVSGSGWLPAPCASDGVHHGKEKWIQGSRLKRKKLGKSPPTEKITYVFYEADIPMEYYPVMHEDAMMWPIGWTDLKPLEMGKFRTAWLLHGQSYVDGLNNGDE